MKKIIFILFVAIVDMSFNRFMSGGFGDSTGAPLKTEIKTTYSGCNSTNCHTGKPMNDFTEGWVDVTSDIPLSGWMPTTTYTITVSAKATNRYAYGFQFTTWGEKDSATKGSLISNDSRVVIKKSILKNGLGVVIDSNFYATHVKESVSIGVENNSWTFKWLSPAIRDQKIKFYLTAICANGNGATTGDYVYRINKNADSSLLAYPVGIQEYPSADDRRVQVYPSIFTSQLFLSSTEVLQHATVSIYNLSGSSVFTEQMSIGAGASILLLNQLAQGTYLLRIDAGNYHSTKKIIKR
jgi:hypothetical protein